VRRFLTALAIATLLAPGESGAQQDSARSPLRKRSVYEDLQMFSQVLNQIRVNHPDSIDTHELLMAAVRGMVHAADPHSYVIPAVRLDPAKERAYREGKLYPVPVEFTFIDGAPILASVAPSTNAARQDLLVGDELVSLDGRPIAAESPLELEVTLAGPKGSTARLGFTRRRIDGSLVTLERDVKRERVAEATAVPAAFMLDAQTGYVRITTFSNDKVADHMHDALARLEQQGMQRLVLDLRDNGGGIVSEAAKIAGEFLPKGAIVYTSSGSKEDITDTGRVSRSFWRHEKRYPIVVMTNGGTASASELVAGALQDHDRGLIVGRSTFGKSLLMRGFPMSDGSVIVLVVGHVKTPCGRVIQRSYRSITRREYFRLARAERDTAGRPSCKTSSGRTVYGGGGIYPDVVLAERPGAPLWLARALEDDLLLRWIGPFLSANGAALPAAEALASNPTLPASTLKEFREFAQREGVNVPADAETDAQLTRALLPVIAMAKYGEGGYYRVLAALDPDIGHAVASFGRAAAILAAAP
jgi:carboxyl-terminal processing protease